LSSNASEIAEKALGAHTNSVAVRIGGCMGFIRGMSFIKTPFRKVNLVFGLVTFVLVFQSWHFVEHAVKLEQRFVKGCVSGPGILGYYFDPTLLHFT